MVTSSMDSGEGLRAAAVAGLGITLLPNFLVTGDLAAGRLARVLPHLDAKNVGVVAVYPSKRLLEPRVRRFINLLVGALGI